MKGAPLSWIGILRLGLVQTSLGAIVVLTTSTINRVMVVELALPAAVPGALVGLHYALQILRPRWGHGSDVNGQRTPWIIFGMIVLAFGGVGAAVSTAVMAESFAAGLAVAVLAFFLVGIGVGAAGTSLLALLASRVAPERRAAAATIVWLMMIVGFIVTTGVGGSFLDPFSSSRLIAVCGVVSILAVIVSTVALWGVEEGTAATTAHVAGGEAKSASFGTALRDVWQEPEARTFTLFVFISMLAYSMQDLILEPFGGIVFDLTPGQTTKLSGVQHSGVLAGMIAVAIFCSSRWRFGTLKGWVVGGCIASAVSLVGISLAGLIGPPFPLKPVVVMLGIANGMFAAAAIGNMMELAAESGVGRVGVRMGIWGAAQAIAFGVGGFVGAVLVDLFRQFTPTVGMAYVIVFALEAALFLYAARIGAQSLKVRSRPLPRSTTSPSAIPAPAE